MVDHWKPQLPVGASITLRGQVQSMDDSFSGLLKGLVFAVMLVYLLMVINFQSWIDPLIILMALPGALSGHPVDALGHPDAHQRPGPDGRRS